MPWQQDSLIRIRGTLASLYPSHADQRRMLRDIALDPALVAFDAKAINTWFDILERANAQPGKLEALLKLALQENPGEEVLEAALRGAPPPELTAPPIPHWAGPGGAALEKLMGDRSTLVPIAHLELGLQRARPVARVRLASGESGTGFLTRDDLLVTNHHVLPSVAEARSAVAQFNYQLTTARRSAEIDERTLAPDAFFRTSETDDWTVVKVAGSPGEQWGSLELKPAAVKPGDRVNIVQHPGGSHKQISLLFNPVAFVGAGRLQYLTDTLPGSSGSPVFDADWNVVGVHHSGGWIAEPGAGQKSLVFRNEGILIDAVIDGLAAR